MTARTPTTSVFDRAVARAATAPRWAAITVIGALLVSLWALTYTAGGSKTAMPHVFYLPIIIATLPFGLRGSFATGVVATVLCGPLMPLNVATGEDQRLIGWLLRGAMFLLVGSVASLSLTLRERFYTQQLSTELREMTRTESSATADDTLVPLVPEVLSSQRFHCVYQPIYALGDGRLIGVEALTRFDVEPYRTPDLWFAAAEQAGCGPDLEIAAIRVALESTADLPADVGLSVNASPATLGRPELLDLARSCNGRQLTVELTEHAVIEDYRLVKQHLGALRALGVKVAVDDAGAGVSSLQHIVQLSPDIIKLDMSLTQHVESSPFRRALAGALIDFAQRSGAWLVVEGIEEHEDLSTWSALGAHAVQGYLVGRPGPLPFEASSPLVAAMGAR